MDRFSGLVGGASDAAPKTTGSDRYSILAAALGGEILTNYAGSYLLRRTLYPLEYVHGAARLGDLCMREDLPRSAFLAKEEPGSSPLASLLFLDTETTGLGGTGAIAFLIGCGSFVEGGFEVRQYVAPDYGDETATLEAVLEEIMARNVIVSYNGKAFDLPLLQGRMIVNRVAREIKTTDHLDLLHAARRLYKRRLADCTLTNIERELLGFHREGDIPGYLIPSVYFDWVSEQRTDMLESVMEHNRLDIVSLGFLADAVAAAFETDGGSLDEADDLHSLARVYGRRRDNHKAAGLYERLEDAATKPLADDAILFHAMAIKRSGALERAEGLFLRLAGSASREAYWACLELAKYYEHKTRDIGHAQEYAKRAHRVCPYGRRHRDALVIRLARLARKTSR